MTRVLLVARREMSAYLRSPLGYMVAAAAILIEGLIYMAVLGSGQRLSSDVLRWFFDVASWTTMIVSLILSMRLIAGEREHGTLVLMRTAPIHDGEIIAGKFLAALGLLAIITALTVHMPLLIFVNGKVSIGHILVGYSGVLLLGAASLAVGLFASALASSQIIAVILGAAILGTLLVLWQVAKVAEPPINGFLNAMALIYPSNQAGFMKGVLRLENVVYYVAITYFFLLAATHTLRARRWR
ncbi:MAG: ABC transporter permease [Polyangiaceae bacterium]|nr:ABC transporter permease [Polyangiaceae bacterium]